MDGQFALGASAYEKRALPSPFPPGTKPKCIQCNNCAYVCPMRPSVPSPSRKKEAAKAPAAAKIVPVKGRQGQGCVLLHHGRVSLDCMGCGVCCWRLPPPAITMVPQESQLPQQDVFNYMVSSVAEKKDIQDNTVKGSQFRQPMLEFSGSCAGYAETSYARLVTQLFGDRMYISNATGCSSIWGRPRRYLPTAPTRKAAAPHGPILCLRTTPSTATACTSLRETIRESLAEKTRKLIAVDYADAGLKAAAQAWLDTMADGEANKAATKAYVAALEESILKVEEAVPFLESDESKKVFGDYRDTLRDHMKALQAAGETYCDCEACTLAREILAKKEYLAKKSVWIFGGDGWAYDIGFGGVDHVLAQNRDVNIFVFDTEVYSNTGGQASKASNIGQVAQFAAAGKETKKKSLAEIAMSYGYVYVAQIAMGANPPRPSRPLPKRKLTMAPPSSLATPLRDALHQGRHDALPGKR